MRYTTVATVVMICTVALLVGGCSQGPGTPKEVPAWSPPSWMRGTWEGRTTVGKIIVRASKYNLVYTAETGGSQVDLNIGEGAESGLWTVRHDSGVWFETGDLYYELTLTSGGSPLYLFFSRVSKSEITYWQTDPNDPNTVINPTSLTKQ